MEKERQEFNLNLLTNISKLKNTISLNDTICLKDKEHKTIIFCGQFLNIDDDGGYIKNILITDEADQKHKYHLEDEFKYNKDDLILVLFPNSYEMLNFYNRKAYLQSIAKDFDVQEDVVLYLAMCMGQSEDFDGLITALQDYV